MLSAQLAMQVALALLASGRASQRGTRAALEFLEHPGPESQQHHLDSKMLTTKEGCQSGYNQWLLFDEGA